MNQPLKLSLEQEFSLRTFADQVQQMSREQAQAFLVKLYEQMMIQEKTYQQMLKQEWRLDSGAVSG
ncbi:Phycobilisome degradation protein nblA [Cylindrospermum stagnale PCC 7417]|uniref:Phycobilisome degradation protein nblA n=1 Tax=Cylindrospermum stagnale PCC 7417 TaxID=56107 RepID=K9X014_9NOST|nr:NblA/ycf18 family protein [Cylindrospermum stagnale]AFZ25396.1 Phycobilisome degradation protein nblA [Cylindrospermum stagnale PCC 7417]